ncbi:hypothetical protein J3454_08595 [Erythrobacter sp. NFXS35]
MEAAEARQAEAIAAYVETALQALTEVETALAVDDELAARQLALRSAAAAAEDSVAIAFNRYRAGLEPFITVLQKRADRARRPQRLCRGQPCAARKPDRSASGAGRRFRRGGGIATKRAILCAAILIVAGCSGGEEAEGQQAETARVSVRVVPVAEAPVQSWVYAQGTARAAQREFLTFQNSGRVAYVAPGLEIGSRVRRGQVIAYLQRDRTAAELTGARVDLANARAQVDVTQAALMEAAASLKLARETFARFAALLAVDSASQQEYGEAEARLAQARAAYARAEAQLAANRALVDAAQA